MIGLRSTTSARNFGRARWLWFVAPLIAYAVVATQQIQLPGVYMDAVNPDYLTVRILNWKAQTFPVWVVTGNYLADRFPVLIQVYHGSQQFWIGLPLYWAFGTDVIGIRLTHAVFGLCVLASLFMLLLKAGVRPSVTAAVCCALAVDASFSYAFRTQSYITMAPAAWLLLSISVTRKALWEGNDRAEYGLFLGGLFLGLAIVGYFVYAFFAPVLLVTVLTAGRRATGVQYAPTRRRPAIVLGWLLGLAVGASTYIIGYFLIANDVGGYRAFIRFFTSMGSTLGAFGSSLTLVERAQYSWEMLQSVLSNWWHHKLMFDVYQDLPATPLKTVLLIAVPAATWATAEAFRSASVTLRILVACSVCFMAGSLIFGNRLGGHHFMALLPLAYASLAVGLHDSTDRIRLRRAQRILIVTLPFAVLALLNVAGQVEEARWLKQTRGVGLFSDAINRLAHDLASANPVPYVFFPDWGLFMPVALISRGTVPMTSDEDDVLARRLLCRGQDVAVAIIDGDRAARIDDWRKRLSWDQAKVVTYEQADGHPVFAVATFAGNPSATGCDRTLLSRGMQREWPA